MCSCHRVERSIRNITCKLCVICAKQSARNARICGRTKIGFCTTITPLLTINCFITNTVQDDWQFVAMVLDRIFLFLFSTVCFLGSGLILLRAPALYDDKQPIDIIFTKMASRLQHIT
ncbi:nAChRa1 [Cordylochernes scorpioides]|uniref:NAChRa1 n=1 Tax=Cordylochernes scorpioides TaxID=51811 RepID=A0ABY6KBJ1_9ARAC|nr:nAChRa1 [Cordylochernes scorpioides]